MLSAFISTTLDRTQLARKRSTADSYVRTLDHLPTTECTCRRRRDL